MQISSWVNSNASIPVLGTKTKKSLLALEKEVNSETISYFDLQDKSLQLGKLYKKHGLYQEAVWALRKGRHLKKAKKLENKLLRILKTGDLEYIESFPRGRDGAELFKVKDSDIYCVIKKFKKPKEREVIAYLVDSFLGLDLVPLTIFREIEGVGKVSLQYFFREAKLAQETQGDTANFRYYDYPETQKKLWLLDFLLDNSDRHDANWMQLLGVKTGRTIAIDNGNSLGMGNRPWNAKIPANLDFYEDYMPNHQIIDKLASLNLELLFKGFETFETQSIEDMAFRNNLIITTSNRQKGAKAPNNCNKLAKLFSN